jgi:hypothetical protein
VLPHNDEAELVQTAERGQVRAGEGSVGHVEVFRMGGVGTPILGRPRPSSRDRHAITRPHPHLRRAPKPSRAAASADDDEPQLHPVLAEVSPSRRDRLGEVTISTAGGRLPIAPRIPPADVRAIRRRVARRLERHPIPSPGRPVRKQTTAMPPPLGRSTAASRSVTRDVNAVPGRNAIARELASAPVSVPAGRQEVSPIVWIWWPQHTLIGRGAAPAAG